MMSFGSKITQNELRRLMRERKAAKETNSEHEKIDSPLANYDSDGRLSCIICNVMIKNESFWTSHIIGNIHKEKLEQLKSRKHQLSNISSQNVSLIKKDHQFLVPKDIQRYKRDKRDAESRVISSQKIKRKITEEESKTDVSAPKSSKIIENPVKGILKNKQTFEENDISDDDDTDDLTNNLPLKTEIIIDANDAASLPSDFFDSPANVIKSDGKTNDESIEETDINQLPKGFFDDPILDAKARHVPYKDPIDEEWERFQKAITEETLASEAIAKGDSEEIQIDRTIEEIDEQITNWIKVENLQRKVEETHVKAANVYDNNVMEIDSDDDIDYDEINVFANWRYKKAVNR